MFEYILGRIFLITGWISLAYSAYFVLLSIFGLKSAKRKYPIIEDKNKFCIFIPCHNEEDVIAATVKNISSIDYNSSLVDFFIIADNCYDNTAANANKMISDMGLTNFRVLERNVNDLKKKGKPHALRWGIELLESENKFYDYYNMFMILDADNFADANILKEINSQYEHAKPNRKPCMIQCYLDSKNANNIIAKGYSYGYRIFCNRAHQLAKSRVGLNATIGGTGFAMTMEFLKSIDGLKNVRSLTEDLELQTIATMRGLYIDYNHHARVYDEKPTGVRQSFVQKTRWAQGHWYVCFKYNFRLIFSLFKARSFRQFISKIDNFIYLLSFAFLIIGILNATSSTILTVFGFPYPKLINVPAPIFDVFLYFGALAIIIYTMVIYPYVAIKLDGTEREKHYTLIKIPLIYVSLIISSTIFALAAIKGLLFCSRQGNWAKTKHIQTENLMLGSKASKETAKK